MAYRRARKNLSWSIKEAKRHYVQRLHSHFANMGIPNGCGGDLILCSTISLGPNKHQVQTATCLMS